MSKRKKNGPEKAEIEQQSDYYKLKTKAVDDLVNANESNSPEVSWEELNRYRSGPKLRVADWVKMLFIKGWFAGAVCYFFIWGLGGTVADQLDLLFVTGFALGTVTDLLTNPVLRFFEKTPGDHSQWMMFPRKGFITLPLNIIYGYVVLIFVFMIYSAVNTVAARITGNWEMVALGVEPVMFGVFCLGVDLLLLQGKHLVLRIIGDAVKKSAK